MTLVQAKDLARKGIKVRHKYFNDGEYMTMKGDMVIFDDGFRINIGEWVKKNKPLLDGWDYYKD